MLRFRNSVRSKILEPAWSIGMWSPNGDLMPIRTPHMTAFESSSGTLKNTSMKRHSGFEISVAPIHWSGQEMRTILASDFIWRDPTAIRLHENT